MIPRGELPVKKTVGVLEENFELRQSSALPREDVGVCGAPPGPIMGKNHKGQDLQLEEHCSHVGWVEGVKGCWSTRASPHEDTTGCDGHWSQPNGAHRGRRRVNCKREACSGWSITGVDINVTLICIDDRQGGR